MNEAVRHVFGARRRSGVVLLCRLENGEAWIPSFLNHYRALGVTSMVFLDTGSTDRSLELLRVDGVTVYQTDLPFKTHRLDMRRWLVGQCDPGTWTLNVDIDELFEWPASPPAERTTLPHLIDYLDRQGYSAMRAHMLDMFGAGPVGSPDAPADAALIDQYPWYDLTGVSRITETEFFGTSLPAWRGGIRATVFDLEYCVLTKHPLIKTGCGVHAFDDSEHAITGERLADITGVLLHFKFTGGFGAYVNESVRRGQHWNESDEYRYYQRVLAADPRVQLKRDTARRWSGAAALVEQGFLDMSEVFRTWAVERSAQGN